MLASDLLANIPRMEEIARIISLQEKHFDGTGPPEDRETSGRDIPMGSRILKAAFDFDALQKQGRSRKDALKEMRRRKGWYDHEILRMMEPLLQEREGYLRSVVPLDELAPGMVLTENSHGLDFSDSRPLTEQEVERVANEARSRGLTELEVFAPQRDASVLETIDQALVDRIRAQKLILCGNREGDGSN